MRGMRTRTTSILALLAVAFAVAATASLAGTAASAQAFYLKSTDHAADHHLNILRFPPRNPNFRPCIRRTVKLPKGDFWHGAYAVHERHRTDPDLDQAPIRIRVPGVYRWESCRGYNRRIHRYQIRSTLRGHRFSHTVLNTFTRDANADPGKPSHLYGNGN